CHLEVPVGVIVDNQRGQLYELHDFQAIEPFADLPAHVNVLVDHAAPLYFLSEPIPGSHDVLTLSRPNRWVQSWYEFVISLGDPEEENYMHVPRLVDLFYPPRMRTIQEYGIPEAVLRDRDEYIIIRIGHMWNPPRVNYRLHLPWQYQQSSPYEFSHGADYLHTQRSTPGLLQRLGMPIVSVYNKYLKHFVSQGYPRRAELTITASTTTGFEKRIPLTITSDFILTFIDYVL